METLIPEISDYQLDRGKPMPSLQHALIQRNLIKRIEDGPANEYIALPELHLALDERNAVPDVSIFRRADLDLTVEEITVATRPLTVVEILSPTQAIGELLAKAQRYFAAGVQSYWLVVPDLRAVAVFNAANPKKYKYFYNGQNLLDPVTGADLPVSPLFD